LLIGILDFNFVVNYRQAKEEDVEVEDVCFEIVNAV